MAYYRVGQGGQTFCLAVKIVVMIRPLGLKLSEAVRKYLWMSATLSRWQVVQALGMWTGGLVEEASLQRNLKAMSVEVVEAIAIIAPITISTK